MGNLGVCRFSLEDRRTMMKTGLGLVLVGHVNFVLGAFVNGAILRHISLHEQARSMSYAVSNVLALAAGLLAVVVGIVAIILSKKKSRAVVWFLLVVGLLAALLTGISILVLLIALVRTVLNKGEDLLTSCTGADITNLYSITNECPFDPTRIYATIVMLWVLLISMCVLEMVFLACCCMACSSYLCQPCSWRRRRRRKRINKKVRIQVPKEMTSLSSVTTPQGKELQEQHELLEGMRRSEERSPDPLQGQ